jgi:hypothetical protein
MNLHCFTQGNNNECQGHHLLTYVVCGKVSSENKFLSHMVVFHSYCSIDFIANSFISVKIKTYKSKLGTSMNSMNVFYTTYI